MLHRMVLESHPNDVVQLRRPAMQETTGKVTVCLFGPEYLWGRQLRIEYPVPESARNAEPVLVVGEVVLEMILLQLAVVGW